MTRNKPAVLYYSVYSTVTGERVSGDAENHTLYYTAGSSWERLTGVVPQEISTDGVYTFTLPASYTDTETAVCLVKSSTEHTLIPAIELTFYADTEASAAELQETLPELTAKAVQELPNTEYTLGEAVAEIQQKLQDYPDGTQIATEAMIPTKEALTRSLLLTDIGSMVSDAGAYSVAAMILGSFSSSLDPETNRWLLKNPTTGDTVLIRHFTTSDQLRPIKDIS